MKKPCNTFYDETSLERNTIFPQNFETCPAQLPQKIPYSSTTPPQKSHIPAQEKISDFQGFWNFQGVWTFCYTKNDNKDKYEYNVNLSNFSRHFSKTLTENTPLSVIPITNKWLLFI